MGLILAEIGPRIFCKKCGVVINADVNGALNILRNVSPNSRKGIGVGALASPVRLRSAG
ncbi:MAG: zinc ribbon domain-containing protein [Thermoproteota archaeon]